MNVSCPSCRVIFRVDPARVPLGGVRATCAACGSAIDVPDTDATDWGFPVSLPERPVATGRSSGAARRSSTAAMVNSDRAAVPHVDFDDEEPESGRQSLAPVSRRGAMPPAVPKPRLGTAAQRSVPQPVRPPAPAPTAPAPTAPAPTAEPAVPAPKAAASSGRVINPFLKNDPSAKAKRLARALVSDMVSYLPAKREEGLRDGTLKQLFREEIKKSYEEYVDQVGATMAESTAYFQDALNDILAGGKTIF